ncbi:PqqD family peptide modification chaperone [Candidatus Peregrinibacteria bacterium]|nr:PqqD family peptide modification chaperone [Candidatus Peregrinibacteria bacterium]
MVTTKPKINEKVKLRKDLDGYLMYIPGNVPMLINDTGNCILSLCDGSRTKKEIENCIVKKYNISEELAGKDIDNFLKVFEKSEIITYKN